MALPRIKVPHDVQDHLPYITDEARGLTPPSAQSIVVEVHYETIDRETGEPVWEDWNETGDAIQIDWIGSDYAIRTLTSSEWLEVSANV